MEILVCSNCGHKTTAHRVGNVCPDCAKGVLEVDPIPEKNKGFLKAFKCDKCGHSILAPFGKDGDSCTECKPGILRAFTPDEKPKRQTYIKQFVETYEMHVHAELQEDGSYKIIDAKKVIISTKTKDGELISMKGPDE